MHKFAEFNTIKVALLTDLVAAVFLAIVSITFISGIGGIAVGIGALLVGLSAGLVIRE